MSAVISLEDLAIWEGAVILLYAQGYYGRHTTLVLIGIGLLVYGLAHVIQTIVNHRSSQAGE